MYNAFEYIIICFLFLLPSFICFSLFSLSSSSFHFLFFPLPFLLLSLSSSICFPLFLLFSSSSLGFIFSTMKASSWSSSYGVTRYCKGVGDSVKRWLSGRFGGAGLGDMNFIVNMLQNFFILFFRFVLIQCGVNLTSPSSLVYADLTALVFQVNTMSRQSNLTPNIN